MPLQTCIFAQAISRQLVHPRPPTSSRNAIESTIWGNSVKWIFTHSRIDFQISSKLLKDRLLRTRWRNAESAKQSNEHAHTL
ncbi:hypothetical protein CEXT_69711 [Caerostris extrusa]|uniref:Uncharacterized protein n=1 Tax=Caerostris extrusa TaxID=172846 RepID=A0AAV4R5K6_CAEEX|nr:hypothetical protein CEXT_69711 [Caerostris extrusa]